MACVIENVVRARKATENEIAAGLSESERRGRDTNAMDSAKPSTLTWAHVVPTQRKRKLVSSKAEGGEDIKRARLSPCSTAGNVHHALYTPRRKHRINEVYLKNVFIFKLTDKLDIKIFGSFQ